MLKSREKVRGSAGLAELETTCLVQIPVVLMCFYIFQRFGATLPTLLGRGVGTCSMVLRSHGCSRRYTPSNSEHERGDRIPTGFRPDSDRIPTGFSWDPAWIFSVWPFDDMRQSLLSTFIDTCRHVRDCLRWFVRVIWWKHQTPNLWSLSGALSATCPVQPVQRCRIWHFLLGVTLLRAALGWTRSENRVETDSDLICRFLISVTTWCNGAVFS